MAQKSKSLAKLAKGVDNKTKAPVVEKVVEKEPEKVLTPEEERDQKAKAKVEELLNGVDMSLKTEEKKEELLEVVEDDDEPKGTEWLEEQTSKLSEDNERLKSEVALAKEDYSKLFAAFQEMKNGVALTPNMDTDTLLRTKVIQLFNELQAQYLALGNNLIIYPVAFMNRLILFFPFLENQKRF